MTTKETLYLTISAARKQADMVRNEMMSRDYTSAERDIEDLCNMLCDALINNFTDEQANKMYNKFHI